MSASTIRDKKEIHAPIERCFLLSTRVEVVAETLGMRLVDGGVTSGHVVGQSRVVWSGWKFGLPTQHHTLITGYEAPRAAEAAGDLRADHAGQQVAWFQDSQERGRFASFAHDHYFCEYRDERGELVTTLEDEVRFTLPFGVLGAAAAKYIVGPHVRRLLQARFTLLKKLAEGDDWQRWLR